MLNTMPHSINDFLCYYLGMEVERTGQPGVIFMRRLMGSLAGHGKVNGWPKNGACCT